MAEDCIDRCRKTQPFSRKKLKTAEFFVMRAYVLTTGMGRIRRMVLIMMCYRYSYLRAYERNLPWSPFEGRGRILLLWLGRGRRSRVMVRLARQPRWGREEMREWGSQKTGFDGIWRVKLGLTPPACSHPLSEREEKSCGFGVLS